MCVCVPWLLLVSFSVQVHLIIVWTAYVVMVPRLSVRPSVCPRGSTHGSSNAIHCRLHMAHGPGRFWSGSKRSNKHVREVSSSNDVCVACDTEAYSFIALEFLQLHIIKDVINGFSCVN